MFQACPFAYADTRHCICSREPFNPELKLRGFLARNNEYKYFINEKDGKHVALFQPVLPRDDGAVVGAMLEVAAKTYGSETKIDPTPVPVEKDGQSLISFKGDRITYYFLLVKEDTGEVNSLTYWND